MYHLRKICRCRYFISNERAGFIKIPLDVKWPFLNKTKVERETRLTEKRAECSWMVTLITKNKHQNKIYIVMRSQFRQHIQDNVHVPEFIFKAAGALETMQTQPGVIVYMTRST